MVRAWSGEQIPHPILTSILPLFYLFLTSFLPQLNLCSAGNLEPRLGNHGLQTLGSFPRTLRSQLIAKSLQNQVLQSWRPSKEVPKPQPGKVPKKCFGKCRSETGCFGKCRKKCSGSRLLCYLHIGAEPGALFSAPSSAPRFGPALSEALFRHFSWPGLRHFFRWPPGL